MHNGYYPRTTPAPDWPTHLRRATGQPQPILPPTSIIPPSTFEESQEDSLAPPNQRRAQPLFDSSSIPSSSQRMPGPRTPTAPQTRPHLNDTYRPPMEQSRAPTPLPPPSQPRQASEVYQQTRQQPKSLVTTKIMETLSEMSASLETLPESEIFQGLRDNLHDLSTSVRALPTREDLKDELAPLGESLDSFMATMSAKLDALPAKLASELVSQMAAQTSAQLLPKFAELNAAMVARDEAARIERLTQTAGEKPMNALANQLVESLGPLAELGAVAPALQQLPLALERVTVFDQSMQMLMRKANEHDCHRSPTPGPGAGYDSVLQGIGRIEGTIQQMSRAAEHPRRPVEVERMMVALHDDLTWLKAQQSTFAFATQMKVEGHSQGSTGFPMSQDRWSLPSVANPNTFSQQPSLYSQRDHTTGTPPIYPPHFQHPPTPTPFERTRTFSFDQSHSQRAIGPSPQELFSSPIVNQSSDSFHNPPPTVSRPSPSDGASGQAGPSRWEDHRPYLQPSHVAQPAPFSSPPTKDGRDIISPGGFYNGHTERHSDLALSGASKPAQQSSVEVDLAVDEAGSSSIEVLPIDESSGNGVGSSGAADGKKPSHKKKAKPNTRSARPSQRQPPTPGQSSTPRTREREPLPLGLGEWPSFHHFTRLKMRDVTKSESPDGEDSKMDKPASDSSSSVEVMSPTTGKAIIERAIHQRTIKSRSKSRQPSTSTADPNPDAQIDIDVEASPAPPVPSSSLPSGPASSSPSVAMGETQATSVSRATSSSADLVRKRKHELLNAALAYSSDASDE